jgi:hypothetical protein
MVTAASRVARSRSVPQPLGQEGDRTGGEGPALELGAVEGAERHDRRRGRDLAQQPGRVQAVHDRHGQVHEDHVGREVGGHGGGVGAVADRPDDLEAAQLEHPDQRFPEHLVVVDHQDPHPPHDSPPRDRSAES